MELETNAALFSDPRVISAVIGAVAGLLAGIVGSLIAPWVNWRIEMKRARKANKEKLIKDARHILSDHALSRSAFRDMSTYSRLKPHLSMFAVDCVERDGEPWTESATHAATVGTSRLSFRNVLLDELAQIEKRWGLL